MVLMAQSGLHVPAIEARLTVFDDVFADIGDEQSVAQSLSTFSGHLRTITRIVEEADEDTLVRLAALRAIESVADKSWTSYSTMRYDMMRRYVQLLQDITDESERFLEATQPANSAETCEHPLAGP